MPQLRRADFDQCIILHGCPPNETTVTPLSNRWMNWVAGRLTEQGYRATTPDMPAPWSPSYAAWKKVMDTFPVSEKSILVGHSCGAAFLVRWLLDTGRHVAKLILVAPAKIPETPDDKRGVLYEFDLPDDASGIAEERVIFTSNDFDRHLKSLEMYRDSLKARVIKLENKGHFLFFQTKTNEFPELLDEILPKTV